jgi:hypothetical protein
MKIAQENRYNNGLLDGITAKAHKVVARRARVEKIGWVTP